MNWHITPIDDSEPHEESTTCKCNPQVKVLENGDMLIIHDAFDGRLGVEWANEILNDKLGTNH